MSTSKPKGPRFWMAVIIRLLMTGPIWFYLLYTLLKGVNAGELAWFLYWVYVPMHIFSAILGYLAEREANEQR